MASSLERGRISRCPLLAKTHVSSFLLVIMIEPAFETGKNLESFTEGSSALSNTKSHGCASVDNHSFTSPTSRLDSRFPMYFPISMKLLVAVSALVASIQKIEEKLSYVSKWHPKGPGGLDT